MSPCIRAARAAAGLAALGIFAVSALAQEPPPPKWGPHFDVELKPGLHRSLMEGDLFLPVSQSASTLVFGDLRARFDDQSTREGNFGLGLRHMLNAAWILGAYGYYDRQTTALGSEFEQATFGFEALGRDWDLRANAYVPFGSTVNSVGGTGGEPYVQIEPGGLVQVVTPGGGSEVRALGGFDAEIGYRLPVFHAEAGQQLRMYAGGYRFEDDTTHVTGPRVRAEYVLDQVPGFWKGARLSAGLEYQNDNDRGSQSYASLRLRIPFGGRDNAPVLTAQERRMTAPVVRDIDIVSRLSGKGLAEIKVESALETADGKPLKGYSSTTTTGADLPAAVDAAGDDSTVLLSGTFHTSDDIVLRPGQTLQGAGTLSVRTADGQVLNVKTPTATISAVADSNTAVRPVDNTTVRGLTISNTGTVDASVISIASRTNVTIEDNTLMLSTTSPALTGAVYVTYGTNITVRNNRISATTLDGRVSAIHAKDSTTGIVISGNTLGASAGVGGYAHTLILADITIDPGSIGNVNAGGTCNRTAVTGFVEFTDGSKCPP